MNDNVNRVEQPEDPPKRKKESAIKSSIMKAKNTTAWLTAFVASLTAIIAITLIIVQPDRNIDVSLKDWSISFGVLTEQIEEDRSKLKKERDKFEEEKRQFAENPKYVGTYLEKKLLPAIVDELEDANDGSPREVVLMVDMASYGALTQNQFFRRYWDAIINLADSQKNKEPVQAVFLTDSKTREVLDAQFPEKKWKKILRKHKKKFREWFSNRDVQESITSVSKPIITEARLRTLKKKSGIKSLEREEFFYSVLIYNNWLMDAAKKKGMDIRRSNLRFPMHMWLIDPGFADDKIESHYSLVDFQGATDEPLFIAPAKTAESLKHISHNYRTAIEKKQEAYDNLIGLRKMTIARSSGSGRSWFRWTDSTGNWRGFEPNLLQAIADRIADKWSIPPISIREKEYPWPKLLYTPANGQANLLVSTISYREAREKKYGLEFSIPYHETNLAVVGPADQLTSTSTRFVLDGKKVAVQIDSTALEFVVALQNSLNVNYNTYSDIKQSIQDLSPEMSMIITDKPFAAILALEATNKRKIQYGLHDINKKLLKVNLPPEARSEQYVIAVAENEKRLLREINLAIQGLDRSGELEQLKKQAEQKYEIVRRQER